jgi:hypothetical protein
MRTVFDLYHWDHPDACAEVTYGFATKQSAIARAVQTGPASDEEAHWLPVPHRDDDNRGWLLDDAHSGGKRVWGVFERQQAETDTERVQLALELLAGDGQTDGDHHKAWVIDQTVRILAGEGYDAFVTEYESEDGDGEPLYTWDRGIAP